MRNFTPNIIKILLAAALSFALAESGCQGFAQGTQDTIVTVNDEPITSYDIEQRTRWNTLTRNFGEEMKAILTGPATKEKLRQMMMAAQPHSQQEAQAAAEKIKKQLIEDAKRSVLAGGRGSRKAVIDALIEDKLKVQASARLGVKVSDREVMDAIEQRVADNEGDKKEKVEQFFEQFERNGVDRKTVQEVFRSQLAWRKVLSKFPMDWERWRIPWLRQAEYERLSRSYAQKLKEKASIDFWE